MRVVADLHVHSRWSRATSPRMTFDDLAASARRKGVQLLGTGDAAHAAWRRAARGALRPVAAGVYERNGVRFVATGEVACVWRQDGRGRRVHVLFLAPSLQAAGRIARALSAFGAVEGDGRPLLAASARDVAEAILGAAPDAAVIPAHVWTPWHGALGGRSGFDSLAACFGPLLASIAAVETGLSSDPAMCRRVSALDPLTLVSSSDAHAPERIGREATVFDLDEVSYPALRAALARATTDRAAGSPRLVGTIELFPQEGKYYHDGHRVCGVSLAPEAARRAGGLCPVCGRALTPGVLHRVDDLADRAQPQDVPPFARVVPLAELVAGLLECGAATRKVQGAVDALVARFGSELSLLVDRPVEDLAGAPVPGLAGAVAALREGRVAMTPGYDGVYGVVRPDVGGVGAARRDLPRPPAKNASTFS